MNNSSFYNHILLSCQDLVGYYSHNNKQKPAVSFQSGHREGNVKGLEIIVLPANRVKKRVITSSYCTGHGIQLIQHEGENNIYRAEKRIFKSVINSGAVDVVSKWVEPDQTQQLLPAVLIMAYFLIDECCEENDCDL